MDSLENAVRNSLIEKQSIKTYEFMCKPKNKEKIKKFYEQMVKTTYNSMKGIFDDQKPGEIDEFIEEEIDKLISSESLFKFAHEQAKNMYIQMDELREKLNSHYEQL